MVSRAFEAAVLKFLKQEIDSGVYKDETKIYQHIPVFFIRSRRHVDRAG
jgi:hypothetical protein